MFHGVNIMKKDNYIFKLTLLILAFIAVPIFLYFFGNFEKRSILMETLSIITILGFTLLLSQFFTSRLNKTLVKKIRMVNVLATHKFVGYVFISVLLLHPFFIIVPKFFDNGVTPTDAFLKLITTFSSTGVILGLITYTSIVILLTTSYFRFKLHLKYKTWRNLHGYLTLLFIITATCHVITIGRHSNTSFSVYYILALTSGIYYLLRNYLFKASKK